MKSQNVTNMGMWKRSAVALVFALTLPLSAFAEETAEDFIIPDAPPIEAPKAGKDMPTEAPEGTEPWFKLLYKVYTAGESNQLTEYTNFYFQKGTSFDRNVEREVQYFTLSTRIDFLGNMTPISVSTVKENWKKAGEGWEVRQSLRVSDMQGGLRQVYENVITYDAGFVLISMKQLPVPPVGDKTLAAEWEAEKALWISEYADVSN